MKANLFLLCLLLPLLSPAQPDGTYFVNAPSGLNVRSGPKLGDPVVMKLPYGRWVKILDSTKQFLTLNENGKPLKGEWLRVEYELYPEDIRDEDTPYEGYVWGAYIKPYILRVPDQCLDYLQEVRFMEAREGKTPRSYEIQAGEYTHVFDPRYEEPSLEEYIGEEHRSFGLTREQLKDTLGRYLELSWIKDEEIPGLRANRIQNPYEIDPSQIQVDLSPREEWQNDFLLPLDGGKDTIRIKDVEGEWTIFHRFVGRIHALNSYVINAAFEGPDHYFVDMTTGEKYPTTVGLPLISPDGKLAVDAYDNLGESGALVLTPFEMGTEPKRLILFNFQSWEPRGAVESAFWISERELALQVQPIIFNQWVMNPKNYGLKPEYRWVKVKVKWEGD